VRKAGTNRQRQHATTENERQAAVVRNSTACDTLTVKGLNLRTDLGGNSFIFLTSPCPGSDAMSQGSSTTTRLRPP
jgi:hypothetical protein